LEEDDGMAPLPDDWNQMLPAEEGGPEPSEMGFQQKKQLFEEISKSGKGVPSRLTEARLRSGMATASSQLKSIKKMIRKSLLSGL